MRIARPSKPRLDPIERVAAKSREAMKDLPVNAVNVMATLAHNGTVARGVTALTRAVVLEGGVPRRQVELAVLRIGWRCRCEYEFGQHTLFGLDAGLTDDEIAATTRELDDRPWSPADRAVLQVVDDLYHDDCVGEEAWSAAAAHFTEADIVQLIGVVGCYRLLSGFLNSVGVERDEGVPGWPGTPPA